MSIASIALTGMEAKYPAHTRSEILYTGAAKIALMLSGFAVPILWLMYFSEQPAMKYNQPVGVVQTEHLAGSGITLVFDYCISKDVYIESITQKFVSVEGKDDVPIVPLVDLNPMVENMQKRPSYYKDGKWHCNSHQESTKQIPPTIEEGYWKMVFVNKHRNLLRDHTVIYETEPFLIRGNPKL